MKFFWVALVAYLAVAAGYANAQKDVKKLSNLFLGFDFMFLVLEWPGAFCNLEAGCCYNEHHKPAADFYIRGLYPQYNNKTTPKNCDSDDIFDSTNVLGLEEELATEWPSLKCPIESATKAWSRAWEVRGTCTKLSQVGYFEAALELRRSLNPLSWLSDAGILPNSEYYSRVSIREAVEKAYGHDVFVNCQRDKSGDPQFFQLGFCVSTEGEFINCPYFPQRGCTRKIKEYKFPSFGSVSVAAAAAAARFSPK